MQFLHSTNNGLSLGGCSTNSHAGIFSGEIVQHPLKAFTVGVVFGTYGHTDYGTGFGHRVAHGDVSMVHPETQLLAPKDLCKRLWHCWRSA